MKKLLSIFSIALVALFAVSCGNDEVTSKPAPAPALPADEFEVTFDVKNVTAYSAEVTATPNGTNRYYFRVLTKMELDNYGIYNDDFQIFEYIIENPNSGDYITSGKCTRNCTLSPKMDFLVVAFNFENWEDVHFMEEDVKLFRYAFSTPDAPAIDPESMFLTANLETSLTDFSLDVTPVRGENTHWTYYIMLKDNYLEYVEAGRNTVVMRCCYGLNNLAVEQGYEFVNIIQTDKLGKIGSNRISAYEPLKNNTEYVVVLFYIDPTKKDPTDIYDYNYIAVEFTTKAPSANSKASLSVSEPVIVKNGFQYDVQFLVKTDDKATDLLIGAQLWANYNFAGYWDPNDWSQIQAFFLFRKSVGAETLAAAKTANGATVSFTGVGKDEYAFFFEVLNAEGTPTQFGVHVTPDIFDNAQ